MDTGVYYHKTVTFRAWRHELKFDTSQELFSSHDVDTGTKFLLRTIVEAGYEPPARLLDLGCGYGPLGITLKSLYPESTVHLTDRDALAVEFSRRNAEINNLSGLEIYGSLGYDAVPRNDFKLIVSNIPGKAGETVIAYLLREARYYLAPGGITAIVVVSPLEEAVTKILTGTPGLEILLHRTRSGHAVFHYRFNDAITPPKPASSALLRGVYNRTNITIKYAELEYPLQTAYGLPEFDCLSYDTELLFKTLKGYKNKDFPRIAVFNPGQGHVPVALYQSFRPKSVTLIDRDLLALEYAKLNIIKNGCPADSIKQAHRIGIDAKEKGNISFAAGVLRDESKEAIQSAFDDAADLLSPHGMMILSGGSTAITRLVAHIEEKGLLYIKARERWRGYSLLALEKLDNTGQKR